MDLILRNANIHKYDGQVDIGIENGKFKEIKKEISEKGEEEIDLKGKLVTPPLVEIHVHMDAVLTSWRTKIQYDRDTFRRHRDMG